MPPNTIEELLGLLATGNLNSFVGRREDDVFEAKGEVPYPLESPLGRYELAKDASAFANSVGGIIAIGLLHKKLESETTDEVTGLSLIGAAQFSAGQLIGILKTHIYPDIVGLRAQWFPSSVDATLGIGCIHIPSQEEDRKPFLISKVVEDGVTLKENVFGIVRRVKADNIPFRPDELYRNIQQGRSSLSQRLTRFEEKLDGLLRHEMRSTPKKKGEAAALIVQRTKRLLGE